MKMINSGAQNCTFTKRHISSEKTTSERLSQNFGCGGDSHQCDKEEFVSGFGIISAYDDIIEPRQSIPLETNAKKTYTHVSCTHLVRRMKALNSSSIHRSGENNTLQEQQEEKLVDQNPMEGIKCLQKYMKMEKKKRRRR
jgi:hypothetical protein